MERYSWDDDFYREREVDETDPGSIFGTPTQGGTPSPPPALEPTDYTYANYNNGSPPNVPLQPGYGWHWNGTSWVQAQGMGIMDAYHTENNGSPPDVPLQAGHGWEWDGTRWNQVKGRGIGYTSGGGGGGAVDTDRTARELTSALAADGHTVKPDGLNRLIIDGRPYRVADAPAPPTWAPTARRYTPSEIPLDDLQGFSFDEMMQKLSSPGDAQTRDLVLSILAHPEVLSDQMVDTLKAKSADELAGVAAAQDEDLRRFGFANGLEDSNWLASERLAGRRARDTALVGKNRDIDILAAQTRQADRLAAADLGLKYSSQQQSRAQLASDTALRAAALTGDRLTLRENIAQKAVELDMDADQLLQEWTVAQMEDLTRRYGIQVQADLDITRLSVQDQQFKEDLAFKVSELGERMRLAWAELDQDDRQFGANLGLSTTELMLAIEEAIRRGR